MKPNPEIDLALSVLCAVAPKYTILPSYKIAEVCGCSTGRIQQIEKKALEKLKRSATLKQYHQDMSHAQ